MRRSDHADVLRFVTLLAASDVELDALAFLEGLVAIGLDRGEVDEHVVALFARNESVALVRVEKRDGPLCHRNTLLFRYDRCHSGTIPIETKHRSLGDWPTPRQCQ